MDITSIKEVCGKGCYLAKAAGEYVLGSLPAWWKGENGPNYSTTTGKSFRTSYLELIRK